MPQVAAPHSPANSVDIAESKGTKINVAYIGACTGAKMSDLRMAASVLKGKELASGVRLLVAPASKKDQELAKDEGIMKIFEDAGASILPNSCGICAGYGSERLGEDVICISSTARNFQGRMGALSSGVYFHALSIAKKSIFEKPFGWGLNRYDQAFNYFNKIQPAKIVGLNSYNNKDGTNNLVKIVVEFGVFSIVFYLFCFLFLIKKNIPIELKLFYLPFVITQSLRGAGYFNGGFLLVVFIMLFTYMSIYKNIK